VYLYKIGDEQPLTAVAPESVTEAPAICWSHGRTHADRDFPAISMLYSNDFDLFGADEITRVNITPPAGGGGTGGGCITVRRCAWRSRKPTTAGVCSAR